MAPGRRDTCDQCNGDMRCCRNCTHYDATVADQCRERRAEPVQDKDCANYCEHFDFARRVFQPKSNPPNSREQAAREQMRRLLGD